MPRRSHDDLVNDDIRIARMRAIQRWYKDRQADNYYPFCHIPDLFDIDPNAERPYTVPKSFIPEDVGGNIQVIDSDNGEVLATETLNQMLGSFLPGGFKKRWQFRVFGLDIEPSEVGQKTNIAPGFTFDDEVDLDEILSGADQEQYTPFEYPTDEVTLYSPQEMFVRKLRRDPTYWWDDKHKLVWTGNPAVSSSQSTRLGQSDPTTNYLWFKHLDPDQDITQVATQDISEPTDGLANQLGYCAESTVLRCYYASLLTLYGKEDNQTFSRTVEYHHDEDGRAAFIASREQSQALLFNFVRSELRDRLETALTDETLRRDLQFALLYRRLWEDLFFTADEGLEHVFAVEPLHRVLQAIDYWQYRIESPSSSLFELDVDTILDSLETVLPGESGEQTQRRLHLMGISESRRDELQTLIDTHRTELESILADCRQQPSLVDFGEEVLLHSLTHAVASWAVQDSAGGASFERWYDVNFQEEDRQFAKAAIYDSIQGGAGISRELYDWFVDRAEIDLTARLSEQVHCYTATSENAVLDLLRDKQSSLLYEVYTDGKEEFTELFVDWYENAGQSLDESDIATMVIRRLTTLFETRDTARFYGTLATLYDTVEQDLDRTPRTVDMLLALEDYTFRDSRVRNTYEQYANRESRRRDLSEVAERIGELTKQCVYACPDCLKTDESDCVHGMQYQEQLLNKNLLREVLQEGRV